jgi:hypothetical protein
MGNALQLGLDAEIPRLDRALWVFFTVLAAFILTV